MGYEPTYNAILSQTNIIIITNYISFDIVKSEFIRKSLIKLNIALGSCVRTIGSLTTMFLMQRYNKNKNCFVSGRHHTRLDLDNRMSYYCDYISAILFDLVGIFEEIAGQLIYYSSFACVFK